MEQSRVRIYVFSGSCAHSSVGYMEPGPQEAGAAAGDPPAPVPLDPSRSLNGRKSLCQNLGGWS